MAQRTTITGRTAQFDESLGLVKGYAVVCTENDEPYFDLQRNHSSKDPIFKVALDFMQNGRLAGETHTRKEAGQLVFAAPMSEDFANAFGIEFSMTGLTITLKTADDLLAKCRSGEPTGFSVGGSLGLDGRSQDA